MGKYIRSDAALFCSRFMPAMRELKSELNEHRYYLERNVELRTVHLLRKIAMLESCNAALCARLEAAQLQLAGFGRQAVAPENESSLALPCIEDSPSALTASHPLFISQGESL